MSTAPYGWQDPKVSWTPDDGVGVADRERIEGNINRIETANRTVDQNLAPSGNTGNLRQFLSWFANRIKAITGKANWYDTPSATIEELVPPGAVMAFARSAPPLGWLECAGQAVSRTTYAALFAAIGTTFGAGDGSTTFNLPNLRGEFVRGWDHNRGVDSGRAFGSWQADMFKAHYHVLKHGNAGPGPGAAPNREDWGFVGGETSTVGGSETRPRNVALMYCIKY